MPVTDCTSMAIILTDKLSLIEHSHSSNRREAYNFEFLGTHSSVLAVDIKVSVYLELFTVSLPDGSQDSLAQTL